MERGWRRADGWGFSATRQAADLRIQVLLRPGPVVAGKRKNGRLVQRQIIPGGEGRRPGRKTGDTADGYAVGNVAKARGAARVCERQNARVGSKIDPHISQARKAGADESRRGAGIAAVHLS